MNQKNRPLVLDQYKVLELDHFSAEVSTFTEVRGPISILYIRVLPLKVICVKCKCLFPLAVAQITSLQTLCHLPRTNFLYF